MNFNNKMLQDIHTYAMKILSYRMHTVSEIRKKFEDKGYTNSEIEEEIETLLHCKYLSDVEYARAFVKYGLSKRKSLYRIKRELLSKGVGQHDIDEGIEEYLLDNDDINMQEYANALNEANKIYSSSKNRANFDRQKLHAKINRRLAYLGYNTSMIISVIEEVERRNDSEQDL